MHRGVRYAVKEGRRLVDVPDVGNGPQGARAALTGGSGAVRLETGAARVRAADARFGRMVGVSAPMQAVFAVLDKASSSDATILLEGETGTGKEISAEAIHRGSTRRDKPFLIVDCGAMPPQLLESELFGHERGSFTGAVSGRQGVFEAANDGTVFLDEIGELSIDLQPKLLRVLERREVRRVGNNNHIPVNVRLIAATNRSLREQVMVQKFRSDLYYRLAVVEVKLPPLRDRLPDLPLLVEHILGNLGTVDDASLATVRSAEFLAALGRHTWPGNIRELRNHIERCVALRDFAPPRSATTLSTTSPMPDGVVNTSQPLREAREAWVSGFERRYLEELLRQHENRVSSAARAAGVDRIYFYRLLWKHGLRRREPSMRDTDDVA